MFLPTSFCLSWSELSNLMGLFCPASEFSAFESWFFQGCHADWESSLAAVSYTWVPSTCLAIAKQAIRMNCVLILWQNKRDWKSNFNFIKPWALIYYSNLYQLTSARSYSQFSVLRLSRRSLSNFSARVPAANPRESTSRLSPFSFNVRDKKKERIAACSSQCRSFPRIHVFAISEIITNDSKSLLFSLVAPKNEDLIVHKGALARPRRKMRDTGFRLRKRGTSCLAV